MDLIAAHLRISEFHCPEPDATVSVGGDFPDDYFVKLCVSLVPLGQKIEINSTLYFRTKSGLVAQ